MEKSILVKIISQLEEKLSQLNLQKQSKLIHVETAASICQLALDEIRKLVVKAGNKKCTR